MAKCWEDRRYIRRYESILHLSAHFTATVIAILRIVQFYTSYHTQTTCIYSFRKEDYLNIYYLYLYVLLIYASMRKV